MSSIKWPQMHALNALEVNQLLKKVDAQQLALACQVTTDTLENWRSQGLPAGPHAALLRQTARLNGVQLVKEDQRRCLLCDAPTDQLLGSSPVCSDCSQHPRRAGKNLGFVMEQGKIDVQQEWFGVVCPRFEFPVCATLTKEKGGLFGKRDPEVGDAKFDQAIHIETDDYEALFDTFQMGRRREIARALAESVTLQLNVNQVVVSFNTGYFKRRSQMELYVILLAWSLAFERSPIY